MRSKVQDIEDRVKRAERWMIGLTAAIALSALCGVVVGFLQWHTLRGQLGEMKSSGKDTRELVEAAKTSADAAKSAANTAVATLEAARKSFVLEQRPYLILDVVPVFVRAPSADGQPIAANVWVKNIGKSPAIRKRFGVGSAPLSAVPKNKRSCGKRCVSGLSTRQPMIREAGMGRSREQMWPQVSARSARR